MLGTSSSKFQEECGTSGISFIAGFLKPPVIATRNATESIKRENYAPFKNPFYKFPGSPIVQEQEELYLVDGGQADQNNPLWPLLQPARGVDVILVNDNSADTDANYPNGTELLETYRQAQRVGLTKMPFIPPVAEFVSKGFHQRATFFGCNDPAKVTLIFLPNFNYTSFDTGVPSSQFEYSVNQTTAMIEAGNRIALQNGDKEWPKCLACGIMEKRTKIEVLPKGCKECLEKYCYRQ
jgi:lysophospholipase